MKAGEEFAAATQAKVQADATLVQSAADVATAKAAFTKAKLDLAEAVGNKVADDTVNNASNTDADHQSNTAEHSTGKTATTSTDGKQASTAATTAKNAASQKNSAAPASTTAQSDAFTSHATPQQGGIAGALAKTGISPTALIAAACALGAAVPAVLYARRIWSMYSASKASGAAADAE